MSVLARILLPLRQATAAFFTHDVALRRDAAGSVRIVLADRAAAAAGGATGGSLAQAAAHRQQQELALIQAQLAELLDGSSDTRRAMRHLAFVEKALARKGLKALHKLPLHVVQKALEQIEGLVTNWSPAGLASLRSKMAVAIIDREHMDPDAEADANRTAAVLDHDAEAAWLHDAPASEPPGPHGTGADDDALTAAYAALGATLGAGSAAEVAAPPEPPAPVGVQAEHGARLSRSARSPALATAVPVADVSFDTSFRESNVLNH